MSVGDPSGPVLQSTPPAQRAGGSSWPWIWGVPIVAVLIAGWLGFQSLIQRGPTIKIGFETGDGLEAGRTAIRYKNVELGHVIRVGLSPDRQRVIATAEMTRDAEPLLRANTEFWVVRPRVGFSGISGLTTLVSGAYIGMLPGQGDAGARSFDGLETPPPQQGLEKGTSYVLVADKLPALGNEAPVYYHGVQVGEVTGHELSDRDGTVRLNLFIYDPHQTLVHPSSSFWLSSGFQVSVDSQGVKLGTESLQTLLSGGVVFDTPHEALAKPSSPAGTTFHLYADAKSATDAADPFHVSYRLFFAGSLHGLTPDSAVTLRGLQIGQVTSVRLEYDAATDMIRIPVTIEIAPHKIAIAGAAGTDPAHETGDSVNQMFSRLIAKGLRAQLVSGNLLTGSRAIDLDFVDDAPSAQLVPSTPYPELPTVAGSGLDEMTKSASKFLDKLAALPLGDLVGDIRNMVRHTDAVIDSPELKRSLRTLDRTLANAEQLTHDAQTQFGPLMTKLNTAAGQLNATMALLGNDPRSSVDLAHTMAELRDAARSIRVLADYLERHPESLIGGKPGDAAP